MSKDTAPADTRQIVLSSSIVLPDYDPEQLRIRPRLNENGFIASYSYFYTEIQRVLVLWASADGKEHSFETEVTKQCAVLGKAGNSPWEMEKVANEAEAHTLFKTLIESFRKKHHGKVRKS